MQKISQTPTKRKYLKIVLAAYCNESLIAGAFVAYDGRVRIGADLVYLRNNDQPIEVARIRVADRARKWARINAPGYAIRFVRTGESNTQYGRRRAA